MSTEPTLADAAPRAFDAFEIIVGVCFVAEYLLRMWCVGEDPRYAGATGRLRYMVTPVALIDLMAVGPFVVGLLGPETLVLRMVRLLRLVALAKMLRYSETARLMVSVIFERRHELAFTVLAAFGFVLVSASALYWVEGTVQPEAFGSIPRAMWWSVATLTTVGYGDAVPVTAWGRILATITAFAGIGLIAAPTGILAASLSDALSRAREARRGGGPA